MTKSISADENHSELPSSIVYNDTTVSHRPFMLDCFNKNYIASGSLFSSSSSPTHSPDPGPGSCVPDVGHIPVGQPFCFAQLTLEEVQRALLSLDLAKSADPDGLEPWFLKLATDFIVKPLQCVFNITITNNCIPAIWKVAHVLLLLKGGDPTVPLWITTNQFLSCAFCQRSLKGW